MNLNNQIQLLYTPICLLLSRIFVIAVVDAFIPVERTLRGRNYGHLFTSEISIGIINKFGIINKQLDFRIKNTDVTFRRGGWDRSTVVVKATDKAHFKTFEDFLLHQQCRSTNDLTLVTFASPVCSPCKKMKKELIKVKDSIGKEITIATIDCDKYPTLSCRYNIEGEREKIYHVINCED